tara:strand:- start:94 stop:465 length:372 start_codon:yes stop_codon:yes gene_type:complete
MLEQSEELGELVDISVRIISSQVLKVQKDLCLDRGQVLQINLVGCQVHQRWARWAEALVSVVHRSGEVSLPSYDLSTVMVVDGVRVDVVILDVLFVVLSKRVGVLINLVHFVHVRGLMCGSHL